MKNILIIEDDKTKIEKLVNFFDGINLTIEESFQGGVFELKNNFQNYELLILDMTIPMWKKGNNDLGGNYEQFGGEKILREMKRKSLFIPTVLFTMFDFFPTKKGNITFNELNKKFNLDYSEFYLGAVFYSTNEDSWERELSILIEKSK
ncbi:hypothetical protein D2V93_06660 [Flagellimonas taeanensis]|uniref:Response regulatory domain-containing protein n=1 Tax=Flagellimonas iocasae TaxID=2055905 RepID=A0ABW4Y3M5_9FLAO|nr:hypothetical protein [Allomuricauda taeanensis]RIV51583.1 hypothetical protein D2V93_06660 [Allomuricauda taeanensis]